LKVVFLFQSIQVKPRLLENDILGPASTYKVYNPWSFSIATILGGPLAAAYLAASNFTAFGEREKARYAWIVATLFLLASFATALVPALDMIPGFLYPLIFLLIVHLLIRRFQGPNIAQHVNEGGEVYPAWRAVVIGVVFLIVMLVVIFGAAYLLEQVVGVE
jgi:hypothetical protein